VKYISMQQLSSVLFNWDKFDDLDGLKNDRIVCVNFGGKLLSIDSLTLTESLVDGASVHRLTIDVSEERSNLKSFFGDSGSDSSEATLVKQERRVFRASSDS
jgi:hypothetical protein